MDLQIGSNIGDYQIIGILGAGGMGKVYKVRNVISDRVEAMKVLLPDLVNQPELADRFLREIKVQASLEHINIAALHTAVRIDNQLVMLMEFVEGVTLEQRQKGGPLPVAQAVDYISQVLAALEYAHQHGVVHRDIKPANMMLTPAGAIKLMDFGIAKASSDHKLTMTGTTMGSLYYMSPEQIQGAATLDARADLYSVGVSLYELVTGKRPFDGDSQFAIMSAHLEKMPVPPIALDPSLPQDLNDVILLSVTKDPNGRFQTAGAFRNALGNILMARQTARQPVVTAPVAPAPVAAPPVVPVDVPGRSARRGLWMAIGALATAAVVIAAIQFGPWRGTKAAPPVAPAPQPTITQQTPSPVVPVNPPPQSAAETPAATVAPVVKQPSVKTADAPRRVPEPIPPQMRPRQAQQEPPRDSRPAATPPQQAVQQPVQQAAPPPVQQPQPQLPAANRIEIQQARESLLLLTARVNGIHLTLQTMRTEQSRSGLNLSAKFTEPAGLMNGYMEGAREALKAGDPAGARDMMEKAERQVGILEKLLNR